MTIFNIFVVTAILFMRTTHHYNADDVRAYCVAFKYNFNECVTHCPSQQMLPNGRITYRYIVI